MQHIFGDCLYTALDKLSFSLGLASVGALARVHPQSLGR